MLLATGIEPEHFCSTGRWSYATEHSFSQPGHRLVRPAIHTPAPLAQRALRAMNTVWKDSIMAEKNDRETQETEAAQQLPTAKLLNANHRRVLAVTLRRVELAVWRLEERLAHAETLPQLALTRFTNAPGASPPALSDGWH